MEESNVEVPRQFEIHTERVEEEGDDDEDDYDEEKKTKTTDY